MTNSNPHKKRKSRAQGLVEFALALPILLTLLYGLLETGRLLFIYASTITAARQAARYGSATGDNPGGTPYYNDCAGITATANKVGFINTFDSVDISYDGGFDPSGDIIDIGDPDCGSYVEASPLDDHVDRIVVKVTAQWQPIVPLLPLKPFTITSQAERTIVGTVGIYVDVAPPNWDEAIDGHPVLDSITTDVATYSAVGQVVTYTYQLHNSSPTGVLTFPTVIDNKVAVDCSAVTTVAPLGTYTCTGTRTITQADLDVGLVTDRAYPNPYINDYLTHTITAVQSPAISLAKSGNPSATSQVGKVIAYTYTITNTGNVTVKAPYTVSDSRISVICSSNAAIPPGSSTACGGTDTVTDADIDNGSIVNTATAQATYKSSTVASNMASFTVITPPILLEVTPPAIMTTPGTGTYTYVLTNGTLYNATSVVLSDTLVTIGSCPSSIAAGTSVTCTGTYNFTQADIDSGVGIQSTSVVHAIMNAKAITSNSVTVQVGVTQIKSLTASLVVTPSNSPLGVGDTILYTYTLTNSGNVNLQAPIAVTDTIGTTITCPALTAIGDLDAYMDPSESMTCTGSHTVTAADLVAGSVTITATANGIFNNAGTPETISAAPIDDNTATVSGPRLSLTVSVNPSTVTALNSPVQFTYTFKNTGSVDLTSPYTVTASLSPITLDCSLAAATITPGSSTSCTGTYTVTTTGNKTNTITAATAMNGASALSASNLPRSSTITVNICNPTTVPLNFITTTGTTNSWTIVNNSGAAVSITTISMRWPNGRRLQTFTFSPPFTTIYSGNDGVNGNHLYNNGPWTIASGATATLTASFNLDTTVEDLTLTFGGTCSGAWSNP